MAQKNNNNNAEVKQEKAVKTVVLPVYTVEEFAAAPKSVGTKSPDIVRAALTGKEKDTFTIEEATELVREFSQKEVK